MKNALQELEKVKQMNDNWDSCGSPSLTDKQYENAKAFIEALLDYPIREKIPEPSVGPVCGGGVQFEWQYGGRELEIEFSENDCIEYLRIYDDIGGERIMKEGMFREDGVIHIYGLMDWLITGRCYY